MKVKCLSLFSALLWFSQSLLHFLLLLGLPLGRLVFGGAYMRYRGFFGRFGCASLFPAEFFPPEF